MSEYLIGPLGELDECLRLHGRSEGLNSGASPDEIDRLLAHVCVEVPAEIKTWFLWHDGQAGLKSLSPLDNRMLLSVNESRQAYDFLSREGHLFDSSWLPLMTNGAGDYLVYVIDGSDQGGLLGYWHADSDRDLEYVTLLEYIAAMIFSFESESENKLPDVSKISLVASSAIGDLGLLRAIREILPEKPLLEVRKALAAGWPAAVYEMTINEGSIEDRSMASHRLRLLMNVFDGAGFQFALYANLSGEDGRRISRSELDTLLDI